jgi:hypothetical protein
MKFSVETWQRITFVSIMIASKCWDDISCTFVLCYRQLLFKLLRSKSFQICSNGKISFVELNLMERLMLQRLDYKLFITGELYKIYYYDMKKFWVNISISDHVLLVL